MTKEEKEFMVTELARYLKVPIEKIEKDILSCNSGDRPLIKSA